MGINSRFLKGSIIGVLLVAVLLVTPGMAFAMQFSEPVQIGSLGFSRINGKFFVNKALPSSSADGSYYDFQGSKDVIRVWWNLNRIGSAADSQNAVDVEIFKTVNIDKMISASGSILEVLGSNGMKVYYWSSSRGFYYGNEFVIFGTNQQGKFIKYIDRKRCDEVSNGAVRGGSCGLKAQNDTLIMDCYVGTGAPAVGRFLFKWDEKAQWFGIAFEKL